MTTTNTPPIAAAGLSAQEAQERLRRYGPNAVPEERSHPLLLLLHKFWSPVPWMLEATLLLELVLGKYTQAVIIAILLVLNAVAQNFIRTFIASVSWFRKSWFSPKFGLEAWS